jgi:hypothetical protein
MDGGQIAFRWTNVVDGFDMPVDVALPTTPTSFRRIKPTTSWSTMPGTLQAGEKLIVKRDYYVESSRKD